MRKTCLKCGSKHTHTIEAHLLDDSTYSKKFECKDCHFTWKEEYLLYDESRSSSYVHLSLRINNKCKYMGLHRWVWEQYHNKKLKSNEKIHHINWKRNDNRPQNLLKVAGQEEHTHQDSVPMMVGKIKIYEKRIQELENEIKKYKEK